MMNLSEWLFYLESRHKKVIQLGLERVRQVALELGLLSSSAMIVVVGGTNGKGSTVMALDAIYSAAGYRVGRYMSPHLVRFNERIVVMQKEVEDSELCDAFLRIDQTQGGRDLTYFEVTTLAALLLFKKAHLDVIILEVGMGGRLDATNILDADAAIVTTVDFDHQQWLGETKAAIAYEKAGIFRKNSLAIYGDRSPPDTILHYAQHIGAKLHQFNQDFDIEEISSQYFTLRCDQQRFTLPKPSIHLQAAATAVYTSYMLNHRLPVSYEHWCEALSSVFILGRLQWERNDITTLYDVSHNAQSVQLLAQKISESSFKKIYAVFSALRDKDLSALIKPMAQYVDQWYPALLTGDRALKWSEMDAAFKNVQICLKKCYHTPILAYKAALEKAEAGDLIVVYGSFLTVGAVLSKEHELMEGELK